MVSQVVRVHPRVRLVLARRTARVIVSAPPHVLREQVAYVAAATGTWSRLWRSLRAAWNCARAASGN